MVGTEVTMYDWNPGHDAGMEDCLEIADALNALLSPGDRDLCDELMSAEIKDFRCFHCPTRCDIETEMLRHCDFAHPYYEAKYHLPTRYGVTHNSNEESRWMCCTCMATARCQQDLESHCQMYHRTTSRHFLVDRTNFLKITFTDRSYLQQPPSAPTPPQESSDILFNDFASSENELEKLSAHATQVAVMALNTPRHRTEFTRLPPISSLLHSTQTPEEQTGYYNFSYDDRGLSPAGSYSPGSVDYQQPFQTYRYLKYSTYSESDHQHFEAALPVATATTTATVPHGAVDFRHTVSQRSISPQICDTAWEFEPEQPCVPVAKTKKVRKATRKKACRSKDVNPVSVESAKLVQKSTRSGKLLKFAGPLSVKRRKLSEALERFVGPKSARQALENARINASLTTLPPTLSRHAKEFDTVLEENLKQNERSFILIAGCRLKVRDYASVVDIHPAVQLKDELRTTN